MEKLFEIWHRSARQRLRLIARTGDRVHNLKSHLLTCHLITPSPRHPPVFCGISLSKQLVSHYVSPSHTTLTHSAPPWACGNLVSCLKSGESSWEGWARYVQQTVEPAGQWGVLSLFTNHCQTPVPGLLLPLTRTHFTRSHSTPGWPSQSQQDTFKWTGLVIVSTGGCTFRMAEVEVL